MAVLAFASSLVACGGGADPTARGAVAYSPATKAGAIVVNYGSQSEANSDALLQCGYGTCSVVHEFSGNGTCGSIAVDYNNGAWGVSSASNKESADTRAVRDCQNRGGTACIIPPWVTNQCN